MGTRRLLGLGDLGRGGGWLRQVDRTDQSDQSDQSDQTDLVDPLPIGQQGLMGPRMALRRAQALGEAARLLADDLLNLLARMDR